MPKPAETYRQVLGAIRLSRASLADSAEYRGLMYSELAAPLRPIASVIEGALGLLAAAVGNVGTAVILLALLLRVCCSLLAYGASASKTTLPMYKQK